MLYASTLWRRALRYDSVARAAGADSIVLRFAMSLKRRIWIAALTGLFLSDALYLLSYRTHNHALYWPQAIGFFLTMLLRGVHSASETDFAVISIPTNALVYASVIFCLLSLAARRKTPS